MIFLFSLTCLFFALSFGIVAPILHEYLSISNGAQTLFEYLSFGNGAFILLDVIDIGCDIGCGIAIPPAFNKYEYVRGVYVNILLRVCKDMRICGEYD